MGDVTAVMMDCITEKSGHSVTPMAVSVCITPAAPAPLPLPYPVMASSIEGIGDAPMRTKINGALIGTVGSVLKTCHGNEPGTLKEVVSLNTAGPCFIIMGAPVVLCELGMMGITGSMCMQNKAPTPGAGGSASDAGGTGGAGSGGGEAGGGGGDGHGPGGPAGGGGAGGGGSNSGAAGPGASSGAAAEHQCQGGHPVDLVTGYVVDEAIDVALPGIFPFVWKRYYSSGRRGDTGASLGPGWAHGFEQTITEEDRTVTLREGQGRSVYFGKIKPGESTFHRRERMTLHRDDEGSYRVVVAETRRTLVFLAARPGRPALLRAIHDAWGNSITLHHEEEQLQRITDTAGREIHVAWKQGRIVRLEVRTLQRLEQWVDYSYSTSGCLTRIGDALENAEELEYDRWKRMTAATLKTGTTFHYEYEANTGRCQKTWGPKGLYAIDLTTDRVARQTHVEGEEPRIITWNDQGLALREALPDGTVLEERAYDDDGLLVALVNGAGEGEQYWYDQRGNRVRIVDAAGNATTWDYVDDLPTRRVTADGLVTDFTYDAKGALAMVKYPSGQVCSLSYDDRGRFTRVEDGLGVIRAYEYDAQHNLTAEIDGAGSRAIFEYDTMGRATSHADGLGQVTTMTHDRMGRAIALRRPDGGTIQRAYDPHGQLVRETDALGRVTAMEYGGMGVLTRVIAADGRTWSFAYTSEERIREIKNPVGETYSFVRDEAGRVLTEKTFDGRTTEYRRSAAGLVAAITYADKSSRTFSYDRLGRMLSDEGSDGSRASYQRDRLGRLLGASFDEDGHRVATLFERDAQGRLVAERQDDRTVRYAYDVRGRQAERVMPDGARTVYSYDGEGALVGVDHNGHRLVFERDAAGREIRRGDEAGRLSIQSRYDSMDRLIEQRAVAPTPEQSVPAVLVQRQWRYDQAGRVQRIDDARWGATTYQYDKMTRLVEAKRGELREGFEYDGAGSLVRALEGLAPGERPSAVWEVKPGNLLARAGKTRFAYDARGRRIGKREQGKGGQETVTACSWDVRDRLREVKLDDGRRVVMTYDALGRRVRKEVISPADPRPRVTQYVWDGDVVGADIDKDRGVRCFVYEPGTLTPLLQEERGEVFTYVTDHLGAAKELIDPSGAVVWAAACSAWGRITETYADPVSERNRGRKIESPFRLVGQIADEETGLCWTRFRAFDPHVGRWLSPDPIGINGGFNLFAFDGAPSVDIDPLGLAKHPPKPTPAATPVPAPDPAATPAVTPRQAAAALGFRPSNERSHGQPVFTDGRRFITPDADGHIGGTWKMARSVRALGSKTTRSGTYDANLNRIGD
jgi:RHS repeat-associated protein